jgi:tetratricopeptide (TPR) repeat protein
MFGLFSKGRRKKLAEQLERDLHANVAAQAALAKVASEDRGPVVSQTIAALVFDDRYEMAGALAEAALAHGVRDDEALDALEEAFAATGAHERAIEVCEIALHDDPDRPRWLVRLAWHLVGAERAQEALDVLDQAGLDSDESGHARLEALVALGKPADALELATALCESCEQRMKEAIDRGAWEYAKAQYVQIEELRAGLQAELHGAETVVLAAAERAVLDARAGKNYQLLAESMMVQSSYRPTQVRLQTPADTLARAAHLPASAVAHALRGSAELRLGRLSKAREAFEAACAGAEKHFAGLRGLGAVVDGEQHALWDRVARLPEIDMPPDAEHVIADLPALTEQEQRVVAASIAPLARLLPDLARAQGKIRLLEVDVRTVDLPEWQEESGARFSDDHRAFDALGGVADPVANLAVARIEGLLDIVTEAGWTFAHEIAHLAYFHASDALRAQVLELYERSMEEEHLGGEYQRSNEHEFFAVSYQDYLRARYDLPQYRMPDDAGVFADTMSLFDSIGGASRRGAQ